MFLRTLCTLVLVLTGFQVSAEVELGEDGLPKEDMLQHFAPYTGRWVGVTKNQATDLIPEPSEYAFEQEGKYILNKTMFQFRCVGIVDGQREEFIFLFGYDSVEKAYCSWFHHQGGMMIKSRTEWAEDGKSYRQTLLNEDDHGVTATAIINLVDEQTIRWTSKVVRNDGQTIVIQSAEAQPDPGEIKYNEWADQQGDPLAMYRVNAGPWVSTTNGKVTDYVKEEYEVQGQWIQRDILGGQVIEVRGSGGPQGEVYEYLLLIAYDQREETYVTWYHDERGVHSKMYGVWSANEKKMTWTNSDQEQRGFTATMVDDLSDPKQIGFTFKMVADDGSVIMDEAGVARRKEQ